MRSATSKSPRTLAEWTAFVGRCGALRDRVSALIEALPETWGLTAAHVDTWVAVHTALETAMRGVEVLPACGHEGGVGTPRSTPGGVLAGPSAPRRGLVRRDAPVLPRERWIALGREVKAIRAEALALEAEFRAAIGSTPESRRRFARVVYAIIAARCWFDGLLALQHPGWRESTHVFYSPDGPRSVPAPNGALRK